MKKLIIILSTSLLIPLVIFSQIPDEEILLEQLNTGSVALVKQSGSFNDVYLYQSNTQFSAIDQDGTDNQVSLNLEGYRNTVWVNQKGEGNTYYLDLDGANNYIGLSQKGDDNRVIQELKNANDLEVILLQAGNNNLIEHREYDALGQGVPVEVRQRGNGLHLIINSINNL